MKEGRKHTERCDNADKAPRCATTSTATRSTASTEARLRTKEAWETRITRDCHDDVDLFSPEDYEKKVATTTRR